MSDQGEKTCPLCAEEMDLTDQQLKPCKCGYQICVWCWHHIVDMAEKDQVEGRCPACRTPYDKEKIVGMTVNCDSLASEGNMERKKIQKSKSKPSEGRKQLTSVRVIQRNLVYIVGLPLKLADEDLLYHREYFGRYGKVLKVSMSRTASGVIQQFPNETCSVYITYAKEEEAVRCIQAVHGFTLDGKSLKACFGTTKYCHAWLRNAACVNPDCLYLHEVGSQEDSFTKDEIISSHTRSRVQQITGATNIMQLRSGSMLPPPLDAFCTDSSSAKPIVKVPSSGTHITNQQSLATPVSSNGSSGIQRTTSVNGTLAFSAVVANAVDGPVSSSDILKRPSRKDENQINVEKSKPVVLKPLQHNVVVDSGSKRITSPDRDPPSNRLSSSLDSSYDGRDIDKPSATVNSFDDLDEAVEDDPTVSNLSRGVSQMEITTNSRNERPDISTAVGSKCDQASIRQPGHEVSKLPHLEHCRKDSSVNADKNAIPSETEVPCTIPEWDWRSELQSHMQVSSKSDMEDISSLDSQRHHHPEEDNSHSRFLSNSSSPILDSNLLASRSSLPSELPGVNDSNLRLSSDRGSDRLHLPNGFGEESMFSVEHSLFANEGRNKVRSAEDDLISNILSLDFDPWDESFTSPNKLAELLGGVDQRSSTVNKPSNLLKQHNSQSRFSFARYEESSKQVYERENHSIYGQVSRNQPVVSQDMYQNNLGSLNGFASNYSGGLENFATSPVFPSYKTPVSRPQVSAPPGFSAPSRLPPPGFSSRERVGLSSDTAPGSRFLDSDSLLRSAYQVPPPVGNPSNASDIEFADPAILAVGRGMINADLDMRSGFSLSQMNSFGNEAGLQMLRQQQSLSAAQQQVNGFHHDLRNLSSSPTDPYGFSSSRLMDHHQAQGSSFFSQLPRQQPSANPVLSSNGHWDKWNEGQSMNSLGMAELLRNERMGFNGSLYNNGYEEPKFRIPSPGDVYNRTYGM
ncbi:hypothetical protein Bca52824_022625 [Brassica carinata]|uniref:CCR4-NOT transcription complex subunit 4 n=1 Tax=Brassica carinata TaxID=52824 RepID=A0A8X7VH34_BRACI|nr:hypothetical protein Bca52824_022625 [Brassica carinata]